MSVRYIFTGELSVSGSRVEAVFDKKGSHSAFSLLWDKIFFKSHLQVTYDEEGCRRFYNTIVQANSRDERLMHGEYDADQLAAGFAAIRRKKLEMGIPLDCENL